MPWDELWLIFFYFRSLKKKITGMKTSLESEKQLYRQKSEKLYNSLNNKILAEYEGKLERAKADYVSSVSCRVDVCRLVK